MISTVLISSLVLTQPLSSGPFTLLQQGEAQGGYSTFLQVRSDSKTLYRDAQPQAARYVVLPSTAASTAELTANGRKIAISLGGMLAVHGDIAQIHRPAGLDLAGIDDLIEKMNLQLSSEFIDLLNRIKERNSSAVIQADDRRERFPRVYEAKLLKLDIPTLERSLSILLRVALQKKAPFRIYIFVPEDHGLDAREFESLGVANLVIENAQTTRQYATLTLDLPPASEWKSRFSKTPVTFYEAAAALDKELIEHLQSRSLLSSLSTMPTSVWRRALIEQALPVYFSDPEAPLNAACDAYSLTFQGGSSRGTIDLNFYWPTQTSILIPQQIVSVEAQ